MHTGPDQREEARSMVEKQDAAKQEERVQSEAVGATWRRHFAAFRADPTQYDAALSPYEDLLAKSQKEVQAWYGECSSKDAACADVEGTSQPISDFYALLWFCL
jgi:ubiquitin